MKSEYFVNLNNIYNNMPEHKYDLYLKELKDVTVLQLDLKTFNKSTSIYKLL